MIDTQREKLNTLRGRKNNYKNVVLYSYKKSRHDHINTHELKRLEHSIKSLREFNNEIPVYLFCDDPAVVPLYFRSHYDVNVLPFEEGFNHDMLNAWSIHRWYNLKYFEEDCNILYVDSDTIFCDDVSKLFDIYCKYDVYGREEFGFRYEPTTGGGINIRSQLDAVDVAIYDAGGKSSVYKYCCGVILLNNNIHHKIVSYLDELSELMENIRTNKMLLPIPNRRICDQYAIWIILSRIQAECGLFAIQDVTQGWIEEKHRVDFHPIVCHYTTKQEQKFAASNPKYNDLIRDMERLAEDIDPYRAVSEQTVDHLTPEMLEAMAENPPIVASDVWADIHPDYDE